MLADDFGKAGAFRTGNKEGDEFACDKAVLLVMCFRDRVWGLDWGQTEGRERLSFHEKIVVERQVRSIKKRSPPAMRAAVVLLGFMDPAV